MKDICSNHHHGNECSVAAFESVKEDAGTLRGVIYDWIREMPIHGATCEELERTLGISHQTCSARITELLAAGRIVRRGDKRTTRSGRKAYVLRVA